MSVKAVTIVWLLLCVITLLSVAVGGSGVGLAGSLAVLTVACLKVFLILNSFMELDDAPRLWRGVFFGWLICFWLGLGLILWLQPAI